jgi:hypothetical protein
MNSKYLRHYYMVLGLVLLGKVIFTLFCGGSMLYARTQIIGLKQQEVELENKLVELEKATHEKYSLHLLATSPELEEYTPITKPLAVTNIQALALNNQQPLND